MSTPSISIVPDLRIVQPAQQLGDRRLAGTILSNNGKRGAGGNREIEVFQHGHARRIPERDITETNLARWCRIRRTIARAQSSRGTHRRLESQHRGDRGSSTVERPTESAERNHRNADGTLYVDDDFPKADAASGSGTRQQPEHQDVRGDDEEHAPDDRALAQTRGRVLQLVQASTSGDETVDRPAAEAEQPQLLTCGRVHRQPVGVVGIPLRTAHLLGIAVVPDRAVA